MEILVEGHKIDTKDIWKIEDIGSSRVAGFVIHLIGGKTLQVSKSISYYSTPYDIREANAPYDRLRKAIEDKWEQDKNDLPTFKL
jgi:hypothetical protein